MIITLIGFSGTGKSYWTKKLSYTKGFRSFHCDDLIQEKLSPEFGGNLHPTITQVAEWMGYGIRGSEASGQDDD